MGKGDNINPSYPALERLSYDELQGLLRQDFYASDEMDMEYVTAVLDMMKIREAESPIQPYDVKAGWSSFESEYMGKQVDDGELLPKPSTPVISRAVSVPPKYKTRRLRRTVAIAAVLVLMVGAITAQALGLELFQAVARWTNEIFTIRSTEEDAAVGIESLVEPVGKRYATLQEALSDNGVTQKIIPNWYPDRFTLSEITVSPMTDRVMLGAVYEEGSNYLSIDITVYGGSHTDSPRIYEKDESEVIEYESGGITHYIMSNNSIYIAVWLNEKNLECSIAGPLSLSEIMKMIDSIYEG